MWRLSDSYDTSELMKGIRDKDYPVPDKRMAQSKWNILLASICSFLSYLVIDKHLELIRLDTTECLDGVIDPLYLIMAICFGKPINAELYGHELAHEEILAKEEGRAPRKYRTKYLIKGQYWDPDDLELTIFDYVSQGADEIIKKNADIAEVTYECAKALYKRVFCSDIEDDVDILFEL